MLCYIMYLYCIVMCLFVEFIMHSALLSYRIDHDHWKRRTSEVVLRQLEPPVRAARRATPQAQRNKRNPSGALNFLSIKCQCEPCAPVLSSPLPSLSLSKTQPPPFLPARPNCTLAEKRSSVHLFKGAGTQRRRSHARQPVGLQSL